MPIDMPKDSRKTALASLERYFQENMEEPLGNIAGGALLDFFVAEIGPLIYNQAISDAKDRLMARVLEVDGELYEEPFRYWRKGDR
jgi:uncharacterized protein (DUF2164 family)